MCTCPSAPEVIAVIGRAIAVPSYKTIVYHIAQHERSATT
jgi:hypothetical protein